MKLSEIADITSGPLTGRYTKDKNPGRNVVGKMGLLTPKAISNGYVRASEIGEEEVVKQVPENFLTRRGDIVLQLSRPYTAALITENEEGLLVPSYLAIIRPKDEDDRFYLLAYLSTESFKENLERTTFASLRSLLTVGAIKNLPVPYFSKNERKAIGERFFRAVMASRLADEIYELESVLADRNIRRTEDENC